MTDFISLPFYDLLHENAHVPAVREKLPPLLTGVRRSILEIGAGSGLITTTLADRTPAEIFALEPSAGMRGILLSRLTGRPELLKRVTVLPYDAMSLDLAEPVEAIVMINVMYAMKPEYRRRLWPVLAGALEPGGLLVFTWRDGDLPAPHPLKEIDSRQVGRHTYASFAEVIESGEGWIRYRTVYRVIADGKVIDEEDIVGNAYRPSWNVLEPELTAAGFTRSDAPDGLLAWRRA
ncbi:class I SAM-dependent methyltransferase [Spongiactinospora sp. 9N601]|uniref:class I SAM-dependent methyltransferase n=1 Tax=Spongiactinospora sp. 9N601 TaxID=3375149 RepID=UPI00379BB004